MARPISDEELQLKKRARRRLVGAVVLVSAVAVILPMVLDSEPKSANQNVDIQIPSSDAGEFKPRSTQSAANPQSSITTPAAESQPDTASAPTKSDSGSPASTPAAASVQPTTVPTAPAADSQAHVSPGERPKTITVLADTPAPERDAKAVAPDKEKPKSVAEQPKATVNGAYVVQVAALSDTSRVKQLQKQMKGAGVRTYTEVVSTKSGEVTRVRAGPYPTREAAEKARTQLKKAGLDGKVVPR